MTGYVVANIFTTTNSQQNQHNSNSFSSIYVARESGFVCLDEIFFGGSLLSGNVWWTLYMGYVFLGLFPPFSPKRVALIPDLWAHIFLTIHSILCLGNVILYLGTSRQTTLLIIQVVTRLGAPSSAGSACTYILFLHSQSYNPYLHVPKGKTLTW